MPEFIVVLDDGETFSSLDGCSIVELPDGFDWAEHGNTAPSLMQASGKWRFHATDSEAWMTPSGVSLRRVL